MTEKDEERLLREVALQNAAAIQAVRQRAEQELAAERERLRITLASIGDAVISTDVEGRVTFLNGVAETLTGWPHAEAVGRPLPEVFRIVNEHTRRPAGNPALRALREGVVVGLGNHTVLVARDGTERPIDDSAAPIRDQAGGTVGAVLVFRDVTDRFRAHETQARLAAIVNSSDDAIVSKTLDGTVTSWNAGAERLFGYTPAEVVGRSITLIIPPERLDEEQTILAKLRRGERIEHFETVRVTKDGRRLDISLTISPIHNPEGRVIGASKIARDITQRVRAERELRESEERLRAALEELRESDRKKDDFIAILAHELRNPLAPVRNGLQKMQLAARSPELDRTHAMMTRQLGHMVRMLDDLLDVSRVGRRKMELCRETLLLADVVASAVETARPAIEAGGHELHVTLPDGPVYLDADLTRLAQVFANLLSNSAKYTDRGGTIWLTASREGGDVVVSVRDTGVGIPPESLPRIFDMFSQVDRSSGRATGGLGIGLALVKGLTEMHGGTVTAASAGPGRGSEFIVRIPALPDTASDAQRAAAAEVPALRQRRILVVDDNRDSGESMAELLQLLGNEVAVAYDGLEAVERAAEFRPEVVLMDVGMPRLNGLDATARIRAEPWGRSMTVIALTGFGQATDRVHSKAAGCDGHLVKPVSLADLQKLLAELDSAKGL